jgi:methionine synthase II (cobalamin-independent)
MDVVRADQIGSLLRPIELIQAWGQLFAGQLAPERLEEIEDRAIAAALQRQQRTGIGIYTDGECRRIVYLTSLAQAVDGFVMGLGDRSRSHSQSHALRAGRLETRCERRGVCQPI